MKFDSPSNPTAPTPEQLGELGDALVTGRELHRVYDALTRHPRVLATPGSNEIFLACCEQLIQDMKLVEEQLVGLLTLGSSLGEAEEESEPKDDTPTPPSRSMSLPDLEPLDPKRSVFETVRRAFHLEDFLLQQLNFSLASARQRRHQKLELRLKMIILSTQQRCHLLEERYGFARSKSVIIQGLRKQTTRILSRLQGEERNDID